MPKLSEAEAKIIKAMYSCKGVATKMEITAKAKLGELSTSMLDFLIEKGMLEKVAPNANNNEPSYQLTFAGKGCFLHLPANI